MAYSNSSLVKYTRISPSKSSRFNKKIDTITIHCMAGNLNVEGCGSVFANKSTKASSNYGVDSNGKIGMYVEEKHRSWASSSATNDSRAVTIEVANDGGANTGWHVSDKALSAVIELCADICRRNGIKKLIWSTNKNDRVKHLNGCNMTVHRDFANKACPGDYLYSRMQYIANEVNKIIYKPYMYNGVDYSPVFDADYYANRYADLRSAGLNTKEKLFEHFCKYGMNERRQAKDTFDVNAYMAYYADLRKAFGSDFQKFYAHYCTNGIYEGRKTI